MTQSVQTPSASTTTRQLGAALASILRCPRCGCRLEASESLPVRDGGLRCGSGHAFPVRDGIPWLAADPAEPDRTIGFGTSDERQRTYWEADHAHREFGHPVVAGFSRQRWEHVGRLMPLDGVRDGLDVGCGNGFSTFYAPRHVRMIGCDASARMLARHPGAEVVMADATALPFGASQFDLVTCWEVLHHVAEPWRVLAEMGRVSRTWVVVFEPNPLNLAQLGFALADREHRWVLRYSRRYLLEQLRLAGLECVRFERVGTIFPNKSPTWLYRVLSRLPFRMPLVGISQLVVARKPA